MSLLNDYITGRGGEPSKKELHRLIERYEWFTTARRARELLTGEADPALTLPLGFWVTVPPVFQPVRRTFTPPAIVASSPAAEVREAADRHATTASGSAPDASGIAPAASGIDPGTSTSSGIAPASPRGGDLIDRFIAHGGHRIDPDADARQPRVDVDIDPEMVTDELAEIYRSQGMDDEAEKIHRILKERKNL